MQHTPSKLTEPEQTNAKNSMIYALSNSYENSQRISNQGKTKHLAVGVLQRRLPGVAIPMQVPTSLAAEVFLNTQGDRRASSNEELQTVIDQFCDENPAVNKTELTITLAAKMFLAQTCAIS
jgi:hypothetical protein